jgi:NAD(P)-dependent dehydrogenase (short-subunit alcohol dehydrogenase family)
MGKKVVLVTGANKGIGLETARQLGKHFQQGEGATILIGARDASRGEGAAQTLRDEGLDAQFVQLDVTDASSIKQAAEQVLRRFAVLDVLVNNAAVMFHSEETGPSTIAIDTLRRTFEANFFGMVAVTQAMLPMIKKSQAGRIVNLTSILGSLSEHSDKNSPIHGAKLLAYDSSKAAVNMFTIQLAQELASTPIKVNAAHPGWVKTDMGGPGAEMELVDGAMTGVRLATLGADGPSGGYYHKDVHMRW